MSPNDQAQAQPLAARSHLQPRRCDIQQPTNSKVRRCCLQRFIGAIVIVVFCR